MRSMTHTSAGTIGASGVSLLSPPAAIPLPITSKSGTRILPTPLQDTPLPAHLDPPPISFDRTLLFDVNNDSQLLSPRSKRHVTQAIKNGWAHSTVKRYSGSIDQFIHFCDVEGVPNHLRFPADEFVLCAFAASSVGIHSRSTPRNRLSALKAWHIAHNMEWKGSSRLRYILNGVHNLAPRSSRRPPRPPINATMLSQLVQRLDLNSPLDVAVAACATTAFWGQCRLGELLPSSPSNLLSVPFPARSGFKKSSRNPHAYIIHLPRTKTHRHGQDIVLVDQQPLINPILLLERHLRVNDIPNDIHLFSYISPQGLSSLTKPIFLRRCNQIWHTLGYPKTTGHCFRIGGTTELLIAGTPPDVVKVTGRWSSDSFLRYWRSLDDIAPQYIRRLHTRKRRRRI
jgi:hypothetical protein